MLERFCFAAQVHRSWLRMAACCLGLLLSDACLYDPDQRCGADRVLEGRVCVCKAGMQERDGLCEVVLDAGAGSPGATCAQDEDCLEGDSPLCKSASGGSGYCTFAECSTDEDCPERFFCVSDVSPSFCSRPPTGQGKTCSSSADCAGFDASFCGVGDPRGATCWVPDCSDDSCEPGYMCYDLSELLPGAPKACVR